MGRSGVTDLCCSCKVVSCPFAICTCCLKGVILCPELFCLSATLVSCFEMLMLNLMFLDEAGLVRRLSFLFLSDLNGVLMKMMVNANKLS